MKGKLIKTGSGYILDGDNLPNPKRLSQKNCDEIFGVVDVEKLAREEIPYSSSTTINVQRMRFIHGFNKAMELNKDKLFTVEDMLNMYNQAFDIGYNFGHESGDSKIGNIDFNEALQSLQQPTEIEVEIVMDKIPADLAPGGWDVFPKLDKEGCIILRRVV
jgi:hypothetical protein